MSIVVIVTAPETCFLSAFFGRLDLEYGALGYNRAWMEVQDEHRVNNVPLTFSCCPITQIHTVRRT